MASTTSAMTLFDALRLQRSIREFSSQPVSNEAVATILKAATWAPSAGNRQPWRFIVIRDQAVKQQISEWYAAGSRIAYGDRRGNAGGGPTMADAPVLVLVCIDGVSTNPGPGSDFVRGASIYPAMQNLMLAACALGLGTRPTTLHRHHEADIKTFLGIPETVTIAALVPLGYPGEGQHFGGKRRKPLSEVAFNDRWGQP